jgi:acyl dehydratase
MAIDREKALAAELPPGKGAYEKDDVILYHLGIGAGNPPTDPNELGYTYEKDLKVLPTFAVVAGVGGADPRSIPGLEFELGRLLHGEQSVEVHRPLPPEASGLQGQARVVDVYDKGKAALAVLENSVSDSSGNPLWTTRMGLFLRGYGGFGGPAGPAVGNEPPDRAPDGVLETPTLPQQALLYRLCGDKNPLHADPDFAKMAGFDKPIIHGLCSYGLTCRAICNGVLGGDVTRIRSYEARFRGVAFPGETYLVEYWQDGSEILLQAKSKERDGAIIISNAKITLAS